MRRVLKKNFWFNVHLILSLLCALPLLVVALSGCFISYHDEIFDAINEQSPAIQKDAPRLKISEILKIFGEKQSSFTPELIGIKDGGGRIAFVYGRFRLFRVPVIILHFIFEGRLFCRHDGGKNFRACKAQDNGHAGCDKNRSVIF